MLIYVNFQGDKERDAGLDVSPMCDRNNATTEKSQVFIIIVIMKIDVVIVLYRIIVSVIVIAIMVIIVIVFFLSLLSIIIEFIIVIITLGWVHILHCAPSLGDLG